MAAECVASAEAFPIRLWIVDNSGSMQASDGSMLVKLASGGTRKTSCSRWQELAATLGAIGDLSQAVGARTDFMLLNPTFSAPQFVSVATHAGAQPLPVPILGQEIDAARLRSLMEGVSPAGTTPLTEAVQRVISLVLPVAPALQARGQQAVVVLATDGQPNDPPSFLAAMQQLQRLPVWLVVRLCTDDDAVVNYWSELDGQLEASLEVLDDEAGEADEIAHHNSWLTYGPPLHVAREFGMRNRLFDLLDENRLAPSQVRQMCELLLGCGQLPDPQTDWLGFDDALRAALASAPSTVDPRSGRRRPWIDQKRVGRMRPGAACAGCCSVQ